MALDLTDTTPFPSFSFGELNTDRKGFTFNPDTITYERPDLSIDFDALKLSDSTVSKAMGAGAIMGALSGNKGFGGGGISDASNMLMLSSMLSDNKAAGQKNLALGAGLKTLAAAGQVFTSLATMGTARANADRQRRNTRQSVENQMATLDNQVLYYKNQITDKFNATMARNTMIMAAKNLRVTAGSIMEQTKDAAYDATQDIRMLESNTELKKIALRNEEKQSKITAKLAKTQAATDMLQSLANLGLTVGTIGATVGWDKVDKAYGDLFDFGGGDLNATVYGGK